jgi:hypothetical protein
MDEDRDRIAKAMQSIDNMVDTASNEPDELPAITRLSPDEWRAVEWLVKADPGEVETLIVDRLEDIWVAPDGTVQIVQPKDSSDWRTVKVGRVIDQIQTTVNKIDSRSRRQLNRTPDSVNIRERFRSYEDPAVLNSMTDLIETMQKQLGPLASAGELAKRLHACARPTARS